MEKEIRDQADQIRAFKSSSKKDEARLKKKMKARFDGRWMIVALFLASLIASFFFYLKTELPLWVGR